MDIPRQSIPATPIKPLGQQFAPVVVRIALSLVYLWFGITQLHNAAGWVSYLPGFMLKLPVSPEFIIFLNGTMEVTLGLFLLFGIFTRLSALALGAHLFGIALSVGMSAVGVRDFGLSLATLSVALSGDDSFSLYGYFKRNNLLTPGPALLGLYAFVIFLTGGSLVYATNAYGFNIFHPNIGALLHGTAGTGGANPTGTKGVKTPTPPPAGTALTAATVRQHASSNDCWLIINNRVYNVTQYIPFHPGGANRISDRCGTDATTAFATKGGTGDTHSSNAKATLERYFVGTLGQVLGNADSAGGLFSTASAGDVVSPQNTTVALTPVPWLSLTPTPKVTTALTAATVATHNSASSCWLIISGKVYDVTAYIPYHPGGTNRITDQCGKDATTAFETKGGTGSTHSTNARSILAQYLVGTLGATVTATPTPTSSATPTPTATPTATPVVTLTPAPAATLTAASVATHNSASNCWLIISGNVYNVTSYIPFHPGGTNRITDQCGKDATTAFETKGGTGSTHSANARSILAQYLIGALGSAVTPTPVPTATPTPTKTPTPTAVPTPTPQPTTSLNAATVATHNTTASCWLIINNNVYDVTAYIPFHPGGTNRIANVCGTNATTAFETKGGTGSHSTNAHNILAQYLLGPLNSTTTPTPTPAPGTTSTPTPTPVSTDPKQPYKDAIYAQYPGANITQLTVEDNGSAAFKFKYGGRTYEGTMNAQHQITSIQ